MSRTRHIPSYQMHKASGQARVILAGKHVYLGAYGSPESRQKYARLIAEKFRLGQPDSDAPPQVYNQYPDLSVNELLLRYIQFATEYYSKDGKPTGEVRNMQDAARSLRELYGLCRAAEFGPRALKNVRQNMIENQDLSRGVVNGRIDRIKRIFRWAVSEELLPPAIYEALRTVAGLRFGRCKVREAEPVMPAADLSIQKTLPFLPPQIADMVRLQLLTGMRSGNLVKLRPCDLDRGGDIWIYEPPDHKTRHLNKRLRILIGPQGQAILQPYLNRSPHQYIFSPQEVWQWRAQQRRLCQLIRKTPVYPCELRRLRQERAARNPDLRTRPPHDQYDTASYRRAIVYGIQKAQHAGVLITPWHPHQLRHNRATEVRKRFGLEDAQLALGHANANIIEVYAERDFEFGKRIARRTG